MLNRRNFLRQCVAGAAVAGAALWRLVPRAATGGPTAG